MRIAAKPQNLLDFEVIPSGGRRQKSPSRRWLIVCGKEAPSADKGRENTEGGRETYNHLHICTPRHNHLTSIDLRVCRWENPCARHVHG